MNPFMEKGPVALAKPARYIAACKGCGGRVRVEAKCVKAWRAYLGYGRTERRYEWMLPSGSIVEGYESLWVHCLCDRPLEFKRMHGRHSETKKCGARCLSATGPNCECQCGGKNHGGGWS